MSAELRVEGRNVARIVIGARIDRKEKVIGLRYAQKGMAIIWRFLEAF